MPLRVYAQANVLISQDNVANPQEPTFGSGSKTFIDAATYAASAGTTVNVAAGATDVQLSLEGMAEADLVYLMAKSTGLSVKLVPVGGSLGATPAYVMLLGCPCILPFKISEIYVSNSGGSPGQLVFGAAGN